MAGGPRLTRGAHGACGGTHAYMHRSRHGRGAYARAPRGPARGSRSEINYSRDTPPRGVITTKNRNTKKTNCVDLVRLEQRRGPALARAYARKGPRSGPRDGHRPSVAVRQNCTIGGRVAAPEAVRQDSTGCVHRRVHTTTGGPKGHTVPAVGWPVGAPLHRCAMRGCPPRSVDRGPLPASSRPWLPVTFVPKVIQAFDPRLLNRGPRSIDGLQPSISGQPPGPTVSRPYAQHLWPP